MSTGSLTTTPNYPTSGLILSARLKTLGVNYVLVDKNKNVGDNWALRYDALRFHTGNGFCETPYLRK